MSEPSKVIQGLYEYSLTKAFLANDFEEKETESIRKLLSILLSRTEHCDLTTLCSVMQTASLDIDYFQFGTFLFHSMCQYYKKWPELAGANRTEKQWIQCNTCSQWRIVSVSETIKYSGSELWYCHLNRDLLFADCRLPQEFPDSEVDPRKPIPFSVFLFMKYFLTKDAIEFLVESGCTGNRPEKVMKSISLKRELVNTKMKKSKKTKLLLRSQLPKPSESSESKKLVEHMASNCLTSVKSEISKEENCRAWKVSDEVEVLWMDGKYKEAIIVGIPNKGDAYLVKLKEDEEQMYTIKINRIQNVPLPTRLFDQSIITNISNIINNDYNNIEQEFIDINENEYDNKWDYEEEGRLLIAIEKFGFNWDKITNYVYSKTLIECKCKWKQHAKLLSNFVYIIK